MILAGVKWQICLVYLDDVIVFSRSPEEHLQHLDEVLTRGFGKIIRIKHRSVSSGILLATTSYVHQSYHEESENGVSFPAVSSVLLSHWMARILQRIYPDMSGYIPDSAEKPGF